MIDPDRHLKILSGFASYLLIIRCWSVPFSKQILFWKQLQIGHKFLRRYVKRVC